MAILHVYYRTVVVLVFILAGNLNKWGFHLTNVRSTKNYSSHFIISIVTIVNILA
jgi:hypothetical protein